MDICYCRFIWHGKRKCVGFIVRNQGHSKCVAYIMAYGGYMIEVNLNDITQFQDE